MKIRHILLTTDFSEEAVRAYAPVCALARTLGSKISLVHVVQIQALMPYGAMAYGAIPVGSPQEDLKSARMGLDKQRAALDPDLDVTTAVISSDNVARGIMEYVREHGVDWITLSTHGRSGLRRVLLGSVAEEVLRRAHVPVLLFPPPE